MAWLRNASCGSSLGLSSKVAGIRNKYSIWQRMLTRHSRNCQSKISVDMRFMVIQEPESKGMGLRLFQASEACLGVASGTATALARSQVPALADTHSEDLTPSSGDLGTFQTATLTEHGHGASV